VSVTVSRKRVPDRRVQRTRHRLKAALLELIRERGYDGMTVEDITERADVGRSTFYSHFTSKEDLLFAGFDQWLRSLTEPPPSTGPEPRFHFSRPLLEHIREQRRFFLATMVRGNDVRIRNRTMALFAELARIEPPRGRRSGRGVSGAGASRVGVSGGTTPFRVRAGCRPTPVRNRGRCRA
jgi:AcrR family transcriptional regulator